MTTATITSENTSPENWDKFSASASELGMKPGHWPAMLETTLGNKQAFHLAELVPENTGEEANVVYARYEQSNGCISLIVFND